MDKLIQGIVEFREKDFDAHKELFNSLKNDQRPHTLFIGCSDSRVVPNLFTKTQPGELFVIRNIGNVVPPWRQTDDYVSTTSAIEYAVLALDIKTIVVCGHSNCGACSSLLHPPDNWNEMPHVQKWLELMRPIKDKIMRDFDHLSPEAKEWLAEQMNVVQQIKNLLSYPFIQARYVKKELSILGWHYIIETGEVFNYNIVKNAFELI